jgi:small subunit ribosomal protein S13
MGVLTFWRNYLKKETKEVEAAEELRHIVRILNTDLEGKRQVQMALCGIKGVGRRCAKLFTQKVGVDPRATLGMLPEEKLNDLRKLIEEAHGDLPVWMMNHKKDITTGADKHVMGTDLVMMLREDLELMKKARSYKGIRHERGLRVRGQRTRSTGRTGSIVGVSRKKE